MLLENYLNLNQRVLDLYSEKYEKSHNTEDIPHTTPLEVYRKTLQEVSSEIDMDIFYIDDPYTKTSWMNEIMYAFAAPTKILCYTNKTRFYGLKLTEDEKNYLLSLPALVSMKKVHQLDKYSYRRNFRHIDEDSRKINEGFVYVNGDILNIKFEEHSLKNRNTCISENFQVLTLEMVKNMNTDVQDIIRDNNNNLIPQGDVLLSLKVNGEERNINVIGNCVLKTPILIGHIAYNELFPTYSKKDLKDGCLHMELTYGGPLFGCNFRVSISDSFMFNGHIYSMGTTSEPYLVHLCNERDNRGQRLKRYMQENKHAYDINWPGFNGDTALIRAIEYSNPEAVKLLVENKADVNRKNNKGESALMKSAKHSEMIFISDYLIRKGAEYPVDYLDADNLNLKLKLDKDLQEFRENEKYEEWKLENYFKI